MSVPKVRRNMRLDERGGHVYMLRCTDGSLYIGSTPDVHRRIHEHQQGRGARYTRTRLPVTVVLVVTTTTLREARTQESLWKQHTRARKWLLVDQLGA
jgi:putative endonuclease